MGCDIHLYVEHRVDGVWQSADKWTKDKWTEHESIMSVDYDDQFYTGRNYELFAMLAGVRNRFDIVPISDPRGFPDDISPQLAELDVDHSASWLTLAELLAYDWTQTVTMSGWVGVTEWAWWRDHPKEGPRSYSQGVGGGNVHHLPKEHFEQAWQRLRAERQYPEGRWAAAHLTERDSDAPDVERFTALIGGGSPYCTVSWNVPYYQEASDFFGTVIPRLLRLGAPDDVRIVFFFDS